MEQKNQKTHYKKFLALQNDIVHGATVDIEQMSDYCQILFKEGHYDIYGSIMHTLCSYALRSHQFEKCDALIDELNKNCEVYIDNNKDKASLVSTVYIHIYYHLSLAGSIWYRQQDYKTCNEHYAIAEELLKQIDNPYHFSVYKIYHLYGTSLCSARKYAEAYKYLTKAIKSHLPKELRYIKSGTYNWLGITVERQSFPKQALHYYQKSAEIQRKHKIYSGLCDTLNSIGLIYLKLHCFDDAYQAFTESLSIAEKNNFIRIIADAFNNLGVYYEATSDPEKAIECYQNVLKFREPTELRYVFALANLGNAYKLKNDTTSALKYYEQALSTSQNFTDSYLLAGLRYHLAVLYYTTKDYDKSLENLKLAESIASTSNDFEYLKSIYLLYTKIYEELSDFPQALSYHKKYAEILKELYEQSLKNIQEMARTERK